MSASENKVGETRDLVAKDLGISGRTYDRYKKQYEKLKETGKEELIEKEKLKEVSLKDIKKEVLVEEQEIKKKEKG